MVHLLTAFIIALHEQVLPEHARNPKCVPTDSPGPQEPTRVELQVARDRGAGPQLRYPDPRYSTPNIGYLQKLTLDKETDMHVANLGKGFDKGIPTMNERVQFALNVLGESHEELPQILRDLRSSLDVLLQLKSIEQNDLAILAESNNRAIVPSPS